MDDDIDPTAFLETEYHGDVSEFMEDNSNLDGDDSVLEFDDSYPGEEGSEDGSPLGVDFPNDENSNLSYSELPSSEGAEWKEDSSVPIGWKTKEFLTKSLQRLEHVQSPSGMFFPGRKAAMEWMKEQGTFLQEDMDLMQSKLKIKWTEDDPTIPAGWKTRISIIKGKAGVTKMQWFLSPKGKMFRGKKAVLKQIKQEPTMFTKMEINKFKSVPLQVKKFTAEYNWKEDDPSIPRGWRSALIQMNSFGKMVESIRYLSPDGKFCTSRVEAYKYLLKDGTAKEQDIKVMKRGMLSDGWMTDKNLPKGWLMKPDRCRGKRKEAHFNYLSGECDFFRSTKAAIAFLKSDNRFSQKDIDNLLKKTEAEGKKLRPDKYDWIEGLDSLPTGWKIRTVQCSNGLEREFFLGPDGSSYSGRKQALDAMRKSADCTEEDIRKMESGCKVVWTTADPTLPPGWKTRDSVINTRAGKVPMQWFMSPDGKMFRGRKSALEEIQSCGQYSPGDVRKFKFVIPENKKTNYEWVESDPSVPEGWLTTVITMNSFGKMVRSKRFMAPDGRFCTSRDDALRYMQKEGLYDEEEIRIMQEGFGDDLEQEDMTSYEGWGMTDSTPSPVKTEPGKKKRRRGVREEFIVNKRLKFSVKEEVEDEEEEEVEGVKIKTEPGIKEEVMSDSETDESRMTAELEKSADEDFVPKIRIRKVKTEKDDDEDYQLRGWRSGRKITSKSSMTDLKTSPTIPKDEGWVEDDPSVPGGWKTKEYINKGGQRVKHIMSPAGQFFAGRKAALDHMESSQEYSQEDMELMQSGLKVIWGEDDPTLPEGWKTRTTDIKTKAGLTQMQWFLSPGGKLFRGRKSALKYIEDCGTYSNAAIRDFKSKPLVEKKFSKDYNWTTNDKTLPAGWKSTVIDMNSFGKMVTSKRFLSPDGKYCTNRIDALKYMVREGIYNKKDINTMRRGLLQDGWMEDPKLPTGWFMKPRKDKANEPTASYHYVTESFQQFDSTKAAVKFMNANPEQYSADDIRKLEMKVNDEAKKICPDKYDWKEDDTIPNGWKYRSVMCTNGLERHFFLAPDGSSYSGRKQAVEYMKKMPDTDPEDIKKMESGFKIQWIEDDPSLPKGWKTRTTEMRTKSGVVPMQWFVTPEGKMFRGRKSALEHLTNSDNYTKEDVRKFRCSVETGSKSNYDWEENDPSVPAGWKSTVIAVNSFGKMVRSTRYLSPDGRFCSSRIDALKYMLKEDIFKPEDMAKMKSGLLSEGWEEDSHLPPDWLVKHDKHKEEEATYNYLTPEFQFLRSTRAAQNVMKNSPLYTEEDVAGVARLVEEGRKRIMVAKYGVGGSSSSNNNSVGAALCNNIANSVPEGWKLNMDNEKVEVESPNGLTFESRTLALRHMVLSDHSEQDIAAMRSFLHHEGWEDHQALPRGWMMIRNDQGDAADFTFLTESGVVLVTLQTSIEHFEEKLANSDPNAAEELKKLRSLTELEVRPSTKAVKYNWEEDNTVPKGWLSRTLEGKVRKKMFLAPDSINSFTCRRSALQHMIKENYADKAIEEMKDFLTNEGWDRVDFLPKGWRVRKTEVTSNGMLHLDYCFLSPEAHLFRSTKSLTEYMSASQIYTQDDIDKVVVNIDKERKLVRQMKNEWTEGDDTVPTGWKIRVIEGKTRRTFFLAEDGAQFACRRSALQHMIKEEFPAAQIEEMRGKLIHEGWEDDDLLPDGWKVRKAAGCTNGMFDVNYYYLSKSGTMFHSTKAVITFMKKCADYSEQDIEKIKTRLENETRKNRPQKYDWLSDENLPAGWKYRTVTKAGIRTDFVLTDEGAQFQSRRAAIEHMIKENFDPQTIFRLWNTLEAEGWVTDEDRLPKGWRIRSKERLKDNWQFYFLSPQMEIFKSNKAVLDFISAQSDTYTTDDYQKVKTWIEDEQKVRRNENYTWDEEAHLPPGWKVRSVVTNSKNIREFFLTPDGDQIAGRKKAIEIMREQRIDRKIIDFQVRKMKEVSFKNQHKRPEDWSVASADEASTSLDDSSNLQQSLYSSDDDDDAQEMNSVHMFETTEGAGVDNNHHIDLSGMVPEFEPVEITAVDYDQEEDEEEEEEEAVDEYDEEDFDDDGFNDVEEITDD